MDAFILNHVTHAWGQFILQGSTKQGLFNQTCGAQLYSYWLDIRMKYSFDIDNFIVLGLSITSVNLNIVVSRLLSDNFEFFTPNSKIY